MRDPKRIPKVLEEIRKIWVKHPDMRLGQLIINAAHKEGDAPCPSIFHIEDNKLVEKLHELEQKNQQDEFVLFYGGPFSQWYPSLFQIDGVRYNCTEQWMMACKARMFADVEAEKAIMASAKPSDQKAIGRKVKGFVQAIWEKDAKELVKLGNRAKFDQSRRLKEVLMRTGDRLLVEASPTDVIWGIGLAEDDPKARDKRNWRGTNWLGEVLTELREEYKRMS